MIRALQWYFAVQIVGLVALPLTWRICRRLPDQGFGLAKIVGIVLVGTTLWLGTAYGVLRNDVGGAGLALLGVAMVSLVSGWRRFRGAWLRTHLAYVVTSEALFVLAFGGWAVVRAHVGAAHHTEQPMDLLFLSAVWTSPTFPPRDPWLSGYPISYYYLGYWLLATIARLAGQPPEIAYNLGQACWLALLVTGCFSLGCNLVARHGAAPALPGARAPVLGGLVTVVAVALTSNPHGLVAGATAALGLVRGAPRDGTWWWWSSSRVVRDVDVGGRAIEIIDEFPAFSYLLGDNHPHVLAMPVVVLLLSLALSLYAARGDRVPLASADVLLLVAAAAALLAVNPWDVPAVWLVVALACVLRCVRDEHIPGAALGRAVSLATVVAVGAVALAFPYFVTAQSQVEGLRPSLFNATSPAELALMFGSFAPGIAALLAIACRDVRVPARRFGWLAAVAAGVSIGWLGAGAVWARTTPSGRRWLDGIAAGSAGPIDVAAMLGPGDRWATLGGLVGLVAISCSLLVTPPPRSADSGEAHGERGAWRFPLLLAVVGIGLVAGPELAYVADAFGTRMNTVFKLYYQAWLLLGVAAAYGTTIALRTPGTLRAFGTVSVVVLLAGVGYLGTGISTRVATERSARPTLNALAYLESADPDELAAIRWVARNTRPDAHVVQGAGTSYDAGHARIAVATGRATLLGWAGHEVQWRGSAFARQAAGRQGALTEIYAGSDPVRLREELARWAVDYVYLGRGERAQYGVPAHAEERLRSVMDLAFESGHAKIFRRRD